MIQRKSSKQINGQVVEKIYLRFGSVRMAKSP